MWLVLESWLRDELDLDARQSRVLEWRKETADLMRSQIELSIPEALAETFSRLWDLNARQKRQAREILSTNQVVEIAGEKWVYEIWVHTLAPIDGIFYAGIASRHPGQSGLLMRNNGQWERIPNRTMGSVHQIVKIRDTVYAAANGGLFQLAGKRWERVNLHAFGVRQITEIDGKLHVAAGDGLFIQSERGWKKEAVQDDQDLTFEISQVIQHEGELYAMSTNAVYVKRGRKWERTYSGNAYQMAVHKGKLYMGTPLNGVRVLSRGQWVSASPDWQVFRLISLEGKLYAGTGQDVYVMEGNSGKQAWRKVPNVKEINSIARFEGRIYFGGHRGISRLASKPKELPSQWQERMLEDISRAIVESRKSQERAVPNPSEAFPMGEDGHIMGQDGHLIFTGLVERIGFPGK